MENIILLYAKLESFHIVVKNIREAIELYLEPDEELVENEKHKVYAASPCKHILHESFVPWNINDTNGKTVRITEVCKSEVNGDTSLFFFLQPVRVYTGQCLNQCTLPVIYMAGSSENYVTHMENCTWKIYNGEG